MRKLILIKETKVEPKFVLNADLTTYSLVDQNNTVICSSLSAEDKERLELFINKNL